MLVLVRVEYSSMLVASKMARWRDEKTLNFINLYRNNECLWNVKSPNYKNKKAREIAYLNILNVMNDKNLSIKTIKVKIKNLRSVYHQELKKVKESQSSREKERTHYSPANAWFYEIHSFLRDTVESRLSISELVDRQAPETEDSNDATKKEYTDTKPTIYSKQASESRPGYSKQLTTTEFKSLPTKDIQSFNTQMAESWTQASPLSIQSTPIFSLLSNRVTHSLNSPTTQQRQLSPRACSTFHSAKGPRESDSVIDTLFRLETKIANNSFGHQEDEFHFFGLNVAAQLRELPLKVALDTQTQIQIFLSSARKRDLNRSQSIAQDYRGYSSENIHILSSYTENITATPKNSQQGTVVNNVEETLMKIESNNIEETSLGE